jgi:uncharacterized protein YdaU (DUF1376 family)
MYHYQKNIGDYRSATMHLSLLEHGVYNQLLDWYYLDEQPLSLDNRTLFRRLSAKSEIEQQAVLDVLAEMFTQTAEGWVHKRVEREIAQFKAKSQQAREAGKLGGRPPKKGIGSVGNRDGFEKEADAKPTANREPLTNNQEPGTSNTSSLRSEVKPARASRKPAADAAQTLTVADLTTEGVAKEHAAAWFLVRKDKNAKHLTQVAWENFKAEAKKAGITTALAVHVCVIASWAGFKAKWPWRDHLPDSQAQAAVKANKFGGCDAVEPA